MQKKRKRYEEDIWGGESGGSDSVYKILTLATLCIQVEILRFEVNGFVGYILSGYYLETHRSLGQLYGYKSKNGDNIQKGN